MPPIEASGQKQTITYRPGLSAYLNAICSPPLITPVSSPARSSAGGGPSKPPSTHSLKSATVLPGRSLPMIRKWFSELSLRNVIRPRAGMRFGFGAQSAGPVARITGPAGMLRLVSAPATCTVRISRAVGVSS
jgi:hypothetical protein